jgi:hypothetical protein
MDRVTALGELKKMNRSQGSPRRSRTPGACLPVLLTFAAVAVFGWTVAIGVEDCPYLHAPAIDAYARHDPAGLTILSNGRHLQ